MNNIPNANSALESTAADRMTAKKAGMPHSAPMLAIRNGSNPLLRILEANARTPFGEIDIVARQKDVTVFVEVKTRISSSLGPPLLNITFAKQRHMIKNALSYLSRHGRVDSDWRIDVVSVKLNSLYEPENIELIENAVEDIR